MDTRRAHRLIVSEKAEHRLPNRRTLDGLALIELAHTSMVTAQSDTEHVCDYAVPQALVPQLAREVREDTVGQRSQGRAQPPCGGELRREHHGLLKNRADEQVCIHGAVCLLYVS